MTRTYHLTTYGCQMNKNDSERIASLLSWLGFVPAASEAVADVIVVNTCSVRQSADERVYGSQEKYLAYKKVRPETVVIVTGCLPGRDKTGDARRRMAGADVIFPIADLVRLPEQLRSLRPEWFVRNDLPSVADYLEIPPLRIPSAQAFVTIQTGCNKYCTYCVVPYARGLERCRTVRAILDECRALVDRGVVEITLLGQSVNSYRAPDPETFSPKNPFHDHFAALLWEINQLEMLRRLHWTAAHPLSMTDEVIAALALPKQIPYLHLPVQSGSNIVLRHMNRKYTREQYFETIAKIKQTRPEIALGTDLIIGFSGETETQFEETCSLYRAVAFDISYHAQYSPRPGTLAHTLFPDDVPAEEKRRRWDVVQCLMEETVSQKNERYRDHLVDVLVERVEDGMAKGLIPEQKRAQFPSVDSGLVGKIVRMRVTEPKTWMLMGERADV